MRRPLNAFAGRPSLGSRLLDAARASRSKVKPPGGVRLRGLARLAAARRRSLQTTTTSPRCSRSHHPNFFALRSPLPTAPFETFVRCSETPPKKRAARPSGGAWHGAVWLVAADVDDKGSDGAAYDAAEQQPPIRPRQPPSRPRSGWGARSCFGVVAALGPRARIKLHSWPKRATVGPLTTR